MPARAHGLAWPIAMAAAAALALGLQAAPAHMLDWEPGRVLAEPWRLFSPAAMHWTSQHLMLNLVGALALALLGWRARLGPRAVGAWVLAWPLTHAGLLLQPALQHYAGLSGVLHAAAAIVAGTLLARRADQRDRWVGGLLSAGLLVKLLTEQPWGPATPRVEGYDFALAPLAHASGAVAGLLTWALVGRERQVP